MIFENKFVMKYRTEPNPKAGSQHGEEGIINEIFKRLGIDTGWIVDVGAWNGKAFSNTFKLVKTGRYHAVEIEGVDDKFRFGALLETAKEFPKITPINEFVSKKKGSGCDLDNLLRRTEIPNDFEFLNLDTDAYDYHFWDNLEYYSPKVVCIEFSPKYLLESNINNKIPNKGDYDGSSFISLIRLGSMKGYTFVCACGCNMFFVRNDWFKELGELK